MFRASICPSSGVQIVYYRIWCSALGVVAEVLWSRCVVLCTVCKFVSDCSRIQTYTQRTRLLRNVSNYVPIYTVSYPRRLYLDMHRCVSSESRSLCVHVRIAYEYRTGENKNNLVTCFEAILQS